MNHIYHINIYIYIYIYLYTINWHNIRVVKSSKNSPCRFMLQKTKKINCTTAAGLGHLVRMLT